MPKVSPRPLHCACLSCLGASMLCVCLLGRASCLRTPRAALFLFLVQTTLEALWLQFRDELSEDFLAKVSDVDARHQAALHELNAILGRWGKTTADVGLPLPGKFDKARPSQHYDSNAFLWLGPFLGWFLVCRLFVSCGPLFIFLAHMLSICLHACGLFFVKCPLLISWSVVRDKLVLQMG